MGLENEFAEWMGSPEGGNQSPQSVKGRLRSLKELTLDVPFSPLDTTVAGLYRHIYGQAPKKAVFDIFDPDEFLRLYGDFVYLRKDQYERRLNALTEPQRLFLQAANQANHIPAPAPRSSIGASCAPGDRLGLDAVRAAPHRGPP